MGDSILDTTKKVLGITEDYTVFDPDIIMHINSVFSILNQLGIGPSNGFAIEDNTTNWSDYTAGSKNINDVKSYMYARVRLMFDPPSTSFGITALQDLAKELEWRLNVVYEGTAHPNYGYISPSTSG